MWTGKLSGDSDSVLVLGLAVSPENAVTLSNLMVSILQYSMDRRPMALDPGDAASRTGSSRDPVISHLDSWTCHKESI